MRPRSVFLSLSLTALGLTAPLSAQDAPAEGGVKLLDPDTAALEEPAAEAVEEPAAVKPIAPPEPTALPDSIQKMSLEERQKLSGLLNDASTYLSGIRVQEAFEKLVDAELMAPDFSVVFNLKGAGYTKLREFEKAAAAFKRAIELDPKAFMSRFNLTEVQFVSGDFTTAAKAFTNLLKEYPELPEHTIALLTFKILICELKTGDEPAARKTLKTFKFTDDHPGYYFGNAAFHYDKGEKEKAQAWIKSAKRIYPPAQINIFMDSFIEVGWIEQLQ